jgi:hypothetical protein
LPAIAAHLLDSSAAYERPDQQDALFLLFNDFKRLDPG